LQTGFFMREGESGSLGRPTCWLFSMRVRIMARILGGRPTATGARSCETGVAAKERENYATFCGKQLTRATNWAIRRFMVISRISWSWLPDSRNLLGSHGVSVGPCQSALSHPIAGAQRWRDGARAGWRHFRI